MYCQQVHADPDQALHDLIDPDRTKADQNLRNVDDKPSGDVVDQEVLYTADEANSFPLHGSGPVMEQSMSRGMSSTALRMSEQLPDRWKETPSRGATMQSKSA